MHRSSRAIAATLGVSLALTACGGHSSLFPTVPSGTGDVNAQSAAPIASALSDSPLLSVPKTFGKLAFTDAGRRPSKAPAGVTLTLRYNHQAELDRFVASLANAKGRHRALSPQQFIDRYAPTVSQEEAVVRALRAAGFTIVHLYPNRTIVDAQASTAAVERFFSTEIHNVHQGKYGERYTNVRPGTVPKSIAPFVRDASLDNLVIARTMVDQEGGMTHPFPSGVPGIKPGGGASSQELSLKIHPLAGCTGQLLLNPGFESGNVDWSTTAGVITDNRSLAYQGNWLAWLDGYNTPETDTLSQTVSIPAGCTATLTYHLWIYTTEPSNAGPVDTLKLTVNGTLEQSFSNQTSTGGGYVLETVTLSSFAGGNANLLWTSRQTGSHATDFFVDSTALTLSGGTGTPSPSPSPTPHPSSSPSPTPHRIFLAITNADATSHSDGVTNARQRMQRRRAG